MIDDIDRVTVRIIDLALREFAQRAVAAGIGVALDRETQRAWELFEAGALHLVPAISGDGLGLAVTRTAVERIRLKRKHRRLVALWREVQANG
jgi:hypothetical protein